MLRLRGCSVVCPHLLAQGERHPLVPDGGTRLRRPTARASARGQQGYLGLGLGLGLVRGYRARVIGLGLGLGLGLRLRLGLRLGLG